MTNSSDEHAAELAIIDGSTFRHAFEGFVLKDPEVAKRITSASDLRRDFPSTLRAIAKWVEAGRWPLELNAEAYARALCAPRHRAGKRVNGRSQYTSALPDEFRLAFEAVFRRYNQLVNHLRAGRITAVGNATTGSPIEEIDRIYWESNELRIHVMESQLVERRNGQWHPKIEAIRLWLSTDARDSDDRNPQLMQDTKSKGGRNPTYAWDEAFQRLVIILGNEGHPETGAELARMYLRAIEELGGLIPDEEQAQARLRHFHPMLWSHVKKN
ncbi:hypothetical protein LP7551_05411 [Roseibium album]|nr:hypothetical protein LP7551_05411 [Roseibium album]